MSWAGLSLVVPDLAPPELLACGRIRMVDVWLPLRDADGDLLAAALVGADLAARPLVPRLSMLPGTWWELNKNSENGKTNNSRIFNFPRFSLSYLHGRKGSKELIFPIGGCPKAGGGGAIGGPMLKLKAGPIATWI